MYAKKLAILIALFLCLLMVFVACDKNTVTLQGEQRPTGEPGPTGEPRGVPVQSILRVPAMFS